MLDTCFKETLKHNGMICRDILKEFVQYSNREFEGQFPKKPFKLLKIVRQKYIKTNFQCKQRTN